MEPGLQKIGPQEAGPRPWLDHYPAGVDWHEPVPTGPLHSFIATSP